MILIGRLINGRQCFIKTIKFHKKHCQSAEGNKSMEILTVLKAFGLKSILKFSHNKPKLEVIKAFLIENGLCSRTVAMVIETVGQKRFAIVIKKKHPRSKHGDLVSCIVEKRENCMEKLVY